MEVAPCNVPTYDEEEKALAALLEAFGSLFSLEQIASVYCKAGRNPDLAGQILYDWHGSSSPSSSSASLKEEVEENASVSSNPSASAVSCLPDEKIRAPKQKARPVSGGTVSCFLGKDYIKSKPGSTASVMSTKPLKLDANDWLVSDDGETKDKQGLSVNDKMLEGMEDFLFKMLGNGFRLEREMIHDVLDKCGYNMQKCMERLFDLSEMTSDKEDKCFGKSVEKLPNAISTAEGTSESVNKTRNRSQRGSAMQDKNDLQKEVFSALFTAPDRDEEPPRRIVRPRRVAVASREPVVAPLPEVMISKPIKALTGVDNVAPRDEAEEEEDEYQRLRRAVKEYRITMKEYYRSAIQAFINEDHERADRLMEQGHFFRSKAQLADDESSNKLFDTKYAQTQDQMVLDLHEHDTKEAIRVLKCHLSSLAGIPSINYLKIIMETDDEEDKTKGSRRKYVSRKVFVFIITCMHDSKNNKMFG
ncbi:unnamed protein product [Linum tenue]|uniref:DUF1771 domain-containing protein n=1 Tax=Linum tenue TaxID=586396 RepID=A0AAV0IF35_9ROSI|nr:unnamed protein product [Linum tenue]